MENINSYLTQLEKEPDNTLLLITIGKYYQFNANYEDAKKFFKMALKINPDSYETYYHLGCKNSVHLYFAYLYKAITLAKKYHDHDFASKVISYISEYYASLGDEYFEGDDFTKATYYFKKAIATNPNCTTAYNGLGYYYYVKMNYPKAKSYYQMSIETSKTVEYSDNNTSYMRALHGLGLCNFHLGHRIYEPLLLNESLGIFNEMLRLNPNDDQGVRYLIPDVYLKMGQYEKAIEGYLSIIEYDAYHHSYMLYNLALAYYDIGDAKNAGKWFQKGIDKNVFHAIFKLAQGRMVNIEDEIMKQCGDTDNFQKKYTQQYDDAYEDMSWSWCNLWLGTKNLPETIEFLEQVYSDKSKYRSNIIPFPKR